MSFWADNERCWCLTSLVWLQTLQNKFPFMFHFNPLYSCIVFMFWKAQILGMWWMFYLLFVLPPHETQKQCPVSVTGRYSTVPEQSVETTLSETTELKTLRLYQKRKIIWISHLQQHNRDKLAEVYFILTRKEFSFQFEFRRKKCDSTQSEIKG